uniref:TRAP transporter small permease n=1 Tax=Marinobacterium profundum TaxID=1714300 RepID=UPI000836FC82|nr:TRAP transporter small permease [Marinobacterium profundum]
MNNMAVRSEVNVTDSRPLRVYVRVVGVICDVAMACSALLVLMDLVLIGFAVVMRYLLDAPITWGDEIVALSLTAIVMLGAPKVLASGGHISVDIVTSSLKGRIAAFLKIWANLGVLAVAGLLIVNGLTTALFSKMIGSLTEGHLELPVWMLQLLLPLGGVLLGLVAIELLWRNLESFLRPADKEMTQ